MLIFVAIIVSFFIGKKKYERPQIEVRIGASKNSGPALIKATSVLDLKRGLKLEI